MGLLRFESLDRSEFGLDGLALNGRQQNEETKNNRPHVSRKKIVLNFRNGVDKIVDRVKVRQKIENFENKQKMRSGQRGRRELKGRQS